MFTVPLRSTLYSPQDGHTKRKTYPAIGGGNGCEPGRKGASRQKLECVLRDLYRCVGTFLDLPVDLPAIIGGKVHLFTEERVIALRPKCGLP